MAYHANVDDATKNKKKKSVKAVNNAVGMSRGDLYDLSDDLNDIGDDGDNLYDIGNLIDLLDAATTTPINLEAFTEELSETCTTKGKAMLNQAKYQLYVQRAKEEQAEEGKEKESKKIKQKTKQKTKQRKKKRYGRQRKASASATDLCFR